MKTPPTEMAVMIGNLKFKTALQNLPTLFAADGLPRTV